MIFFMLASKTQPCVCWQAGFMAKFVTSQPLPRNHQCSTSALAHIVRDWAGNKDRE